jgi:hypothetical protein
MSMSTSHRPGRARATGRWLFWAPVLMVGGLLYWTVALGLGGLSLVAVTALSAASGDTGATLSSGASDTLVVTTDNVDDGDDVRPGDPITVHLQESVEPEDVNDNPGAGSATGTDDPAAVAAPAPGPTAF